MDQEYFAADNEQESVWKRIEIVPDTRFLLIRMADTKMILMELACCIGILFLDEILDAAIFVESYDLRRKYSTAVIFMIHVSVASDFQRCQRRPGISHLTQSC